MQLSSSLDLAAVLDSIAENALSLVGATNCIIYFYDEASGTLVFGTALWEDGRREAAVKSPRRNGLTATVAREGRAMVINDATQHPLYTTPEARKWGLQAIAGFPLKRVGRVLGVFTIAFFEPHTLSEEELRVLGLLADQAAIAIENARLYHEAQEADRLKSAFLASMSHELRTPLNSIIGFTGIMLQSLAGPLNPEQEKQLNMVYDSAKHLLALINDVLDISKIEAGQLEVASELFDIRQAIEKVVRTVTPLAEKKGLALLTRVAPEVGQIVSDRRRVEQILINLLNNAVKFTEQGEVRIACQVDDGWLVTRVVDTGIGIKPEDIGKLFKPFRQIETGLTRRYEGTGLGLSICRRLVEMLGGEIWAESEGEGKGSVFGFTLPVG
jgi:signal transduction histidine kinase